MIVLVMRTYLIPGILLLIATSVRAQQNSIAGKWQLDLSKTIGLMDNTVKQKFDGLDQDVKTRMEISMTDRTFSFNEDGNVTVNWKSQGNPRVSTGTWEVSNETLMITIGGDVQQYTFEKTTGSHLVLRNTVPAGFFSNLYLTWQP